MKEDQSRRKFMHTSGAMRQYMWDEEAGTFLSVKMDTMEKIPVATIS